MDEHDVRSFVDLEDHPELTSLSRVQPFKFAPEGLPRSIPVLGDRPEDRSDDGRSHLRRKPVEVPEALRRDLDLVHELDVVLEPNPLALKPSPLCVRVLGGMSLPACLCWGSALPS